MFKGNGLKKNILKEKGFFWAYGGKKNLDQKTTKKLAKRDKGQKSFFKKLYFGGDSKNLFLKEKKKKKVNLRLAFERLPKRKKRVFQKGKGINGKGGGKTWLKRGGNPKSLNFKKKGALAGGDPRPKTFKKGEKAFI